MQVVSMFRLFADEHFNKDKLLSPNGHTLRMIFS